MKLKFAQSVLNWFTSPSRPAFPPPSSHHVKTSTSFGVDVPPLSPPHAVAARSAATPITATDTRLVRRINPSDQDMTSLSQTIVRHSGRTFLASQRSSASFPSQFVGTTYKARPNRAWI